MITIQTDRCKGCGLCVAACPKQIIVLARDVINKKGHNPATVTDQSACIGCAFCATMCPDCVITVEKTAGAVSGRPQTVGAVSGRPQN